MWCESVVPCYTEDFAIDFGMIGLSPPEYIVDLNGFNKSLYSTYNICSLNLIKRIPRCSASGLIR